MHLLSDIITYVRRIIKSPSDATVSDNLIIDYINRFYITDVQARIQLFDYKTKYQFMTQAGVDQYNMPLYDVQTESTTGDPQIGIFPVYQGFVGPAYVDGIQVPLQTQKSGFFNIWPNIVQENRVIAIGNDSPGPYLLRFPIVPNRYPIPINPPVNCILRGHINITGIISTGNNQDPPIIDGFGAQIETIPTTSVFPAVYFTSIDATGAPVVICDSGQFLTGHVNHGLLMKPGSAPYGNLTLPNGGNLTSGPYAFNQNTINYFDGTAHNVYFPVDIPAGAEISATCYFFQTGLPRSILYYDNTLTFRSPPDRQYLVEIDAYLSPAAFFNTAAAIPFGYMAEYLARGAARKILSDTADADQLAFYEPLFKEQEMLVWKRSQRQWTASRTQTIYSEGINQGQNGFNNIGGSTF